MSIQRVFPLFAAVFALVYLGAEQFNVALVTYHPRIGQWDLWTQPARSGPAMYWYGWIGTAALGATVASLAALPFARRLDRYSAMGWIAPLAAMLAFVYLLRVFFIR